MSLYAYICPEGHEIEERHPIGKAPNTVVCPDHAHECRRSFGAVAFTTNDEYRKAWLSTAGSSRDPLAPKDKYDVAKIREATGRNYFGNDVSQVKLTPELSEKYKQ
jgi:hypothetical protein